MKVHRRDFRFKILLISFLLGLTMIGVYHVAESCGIDWSPYFFIPYSPEERELIKRMAVVKVQGKDPLEGDHGQDDTYLRIYYETYVDDFNPIITKEINRSYELIAKGQTKAALSKDRAILTRLRNYVHLNNVRSKKLLIFLNTVEERTLLVKQNPSSALTKSLLSILQSMEQGNYDDALGKIKSMERAIPNRQRFYTTWYTFLLKRLFRKPIAEREYPKIATAPKVYRDRVALAAAKSALREGNAKWVPVLKDLAAKDSEYRDDARMELARFYAKTDQMDKAWDEIKPLISGKAKPHFRAQELVVEWVIKDNKNYPSDKVAEFIRRIDQLSTRYRNAREDGGWEKPRITEGEIYKAAEDLVNTLGENRAYWMAILEYYRGVGAYISGNYEDARNIFTRLVTEYPIHYFAPRAYYYLFYCLHNVSSNRWGVDYMAEFNKYLLAFARAYPDHTLLDDSINLFLHHYPPQDLNPEIPKKFLEGWNEADTLNELLVKLGEAYRDDILASSARDRYLYVSRRWLELLSGFPESRFSPVAYLKYSHHISDDKSTDVLVKYSDFVLNNASRFDPGFVKSIKDDYLRSKFLAGKHDEIKRMKPTSGMEFWYHALAFFKTGDDTKAVEALKKLADRENETYYREQAAQFLTDYFFKTEPLTSLYYFTKLLESTKETWEAAVGHGYYNYPTYSLRESDEYEVRGLYFRYSGAYKTTALGDYLETYLSEKDVELFLKNHGGRKSSEAIQSSLAMRYLRQFRFDDALRIARQINDQALIERVKNVKEHYSTDSDAGLYATGAWFYHGDGAIFSSNTTSYLYEAGESLEQIQNGYLGRLNKYLIARKMFMRLIQQYPGSKLIDKAHYSAALCDLYVWSYHSFFQKFGEELFEDAKKNFLAVYYKAPQSTLADDALYWAGYLSKDESERKRYWDLIRKEYPQGDVLRKWESLPAPRDR